MNPNYSSPRNFAPTHTNGLPFYNPTTKEQLPTSFNPTYPKSPGSGHFIPATQMTSSKSYMVKPQYEPIKSGGNSSGYFKPQIDPPAYNNSNGFNPVFPKSSQMVKSSFHDSTKSTESTITFNKNEPKQQMTLTPPRRQPRFSEPANFQSPFQSNQDTKASFVPFNKKEETLKEETQQEIHFYKKPTTSNNTPEQLKEQKEKEGRQWLKQSKNIKRQNKISLENFEMVKNLGNGKYGQVFLARQRKSNFICALKVIQKSLLIEEEIVEQFMRQIKIQMYLNHPNVIKLYGCFDDEKNIYIVLEVAMGGQLFQQLKRSEPMPEAKVAPIMKQVCTAVQELHASRIIHRDIKPENIVLHQGIVKLCDFGWSVHLGDKMRTTFCGTPLYVCPEILKGNEYDQKIDIWSLGIMMYQMLVGENPFKISKEEELIKIVKDQISIPSYVYVSKEARDFLDKCLQKNPLDRVTIKQLVTHEFFIKNAEKEKNEKKMTL